MTQVINLADRRLAMAEPAAPGQDRVMDLLLVLAEEMGLDTSKYRGSARPLELEAASRLNTQVRPFVMPPKPGGRNAPKPRKGASP